ncbi:hypothetical protein MN116_008744 [Schistosoma mekongi]|uniref:Uncharacterized protein n=1 Tax=Schistosoma mekongi TaxID=38744 RepID=A0AAE1Z649_SCHME|nr:hypothetical protein MN116_008744 [Schistosoma mekongi]
MTKPIESSIKETIQKILISSGEPVSTSNLVVDLIYDYIRINANQIRSQLSTNLPELRDLLIVCRNQPFRLIRIIKYYRTMCNSSFIKTIGLTMNSINEQLSSFINEYNESDDDDDDDDNDDDDNNDVNDDDNEDYNLIDTNITLNHSKHFNNLLLSNRNSNWLRLHNLFNQLSIPLPNHINFWQTFNSTLNQIYTKLNKGRLLRLSRIDYKLANESIDEFLSFNRLRQSASFINLTRSRNYHKFLYWFYYCSSSSMNTTSSLSSLSSSSSSPSSSSSHEGLILLAYLLNGDVLDIIDMVLFNRQKLGINLSSPITPIEIKQVLCIFTNVLYPRKTT